MARWIHGLFFLTLVALTGCSDGRKALYPVHGKILDAAGQPLSEAVVYFNPVENPAETKHKPAGMADKEGNFSLTTYRENDGAPAGNYVVTLEWKPVRRSLLDPDLPDRLEGRFRDPATSKLTATVAKGENDLVIQLTQ
jgi:hypothetical protein